MFWIILTALATIFVGVFMYYIGSMTLFGQSGVATLVNSSMANMTSVPSQAWTTMDLMTKMWPIWIFVFVFSCILWALIMSQKQEPEYVR